MTESIETLPSVEVTPEEESHVHVHNEEILGLIIKIVGELAVGHPEEDLSDLVYLATKSTLFSRELRPVKGSVAPAVFAYYLKVYATLVQQHAESPIDAHTAFTQAALSVIDLAITRPKDYTAHRLIRLVGPAIHEVVTLNIGKIEGLNMMEALGDVMSVALITESLGIYGAPKRIRDNTDYLLWAKLFLEQALMEPRLEFVKKDDVLKAVLPQLNARTKIVKLPD